jgi:hypothetical protein
VGSDENEEREPITGDPSQALGRREDKTPGQDIARRGTSTEEPDVQLNVPVLKVEEINLEVDDLRARVSLHAAVANLVTLDVGADVLVGRVKLGIKGVEAQAVLKVRLEQVYAILERTLTTIDSNPQILEKLLQPVGDTVEALGRTVERTLPEVGGAVSRTVEKTVPDLGGSVGRTVEQTVPRVGQAAGDLAKSAGPAVGQAAADLAKSAAPAVGRAAGGVAPARSEPRWDLAVGSDAAESIAAFDGSKAALDRWRHVGGGSVRCEDGELRLRAGDEPGLLYFTGQRFDDFDLRLQFRPEPGFQMGTSIRFRDPAEPVPDRAEPERLYRYDDPAFVALHTGFEVQMGSQRPAVEPGTFEGVLFGDASGAQRHAERAEVAANEWNTLEVRVRGDEYTVRLNGKETARFRNVDAFRGWPAMRSPEAGFIGLVLRKGRAAIRRIDVEVRRPSPPEARARASAGHRDESTRQERHAHDPRSRAP